MDFDIARIKLGEIYTIPHNQRDLLLVEIRKIYPNVYFVITQNDSVAVMGSLK